MTKAELETDLKRRLYNYNADKYGCANVDILGTRKTAHYLSYDKSEVWRAYEIRVNKTNFREKRYPTFVGDLNYYVLPRCVFRQVEREIPDNIGVLVPSGGDTLESVKMPRSIEKPVEERTLFNSLIKALAKSSDRYFQIFCIINGNKKVME